MSNYRVIGSLKSNVNFKLQWFVFSIKFALIFKILDQNVNVVTPNLFNWTCLYRSDKLNWLTNEIMINHSIRHMTMMQSLLYRFVCILHIIHLNLLLKCNINDNTLHEILSNSHL